MLPFSGYAFNKSHTARYGLVSHWTAYLKTNATGTPIFAGRARNRPAPLNFALHGNHSLSEKRIDNIQGRVLGSELRQAADRRRFGRCAFKRAPGLATLSSR